MKRPALKCLPHSYSGQRKNNKKEKHTVLKGCLSGLSLHLEGRKALNCGEADAVPPARADLSCQPVLLQLQQLQTEGHNLTQASLCWDFTGSAPQPGRQKH